MPPISVDLQVERFTGACLLQVAKLLGGEWRLNGNTLRNLSTCVQWGEPVYATETHFARNSMDLPQ